MSDFAVTVFHNPACGTSRNVVAAVKEAGLEPTVVEYLKTGWTKAQLKDLLSQMDARPADILRTRGTKAEELGLTEAGTADEVILEAMVADPILVNRPIVVTPKGAALCRPSDMVASLLP